MNSLSLVIFGITSNLAQIKLIPALYDIAEKNMLPKNAQIIGVARSPKSPAELEKYLWETLNKENRHHPHPIKRTVFDKLCQSFEYLDGHVDNSEFYKKLAVILDSSKEPHTLRFSQGDKQQNIIFYLATYPGLYQQIFENLKNSGLNQQKSGWVRLMIEKPLGNDLASAQKLNRLLSEYFSEDQIYRLDHYLGKETLQNILAFRFANSIFEPMISKDHIDHIQVTATEDFGIGKRGGYYDSVGALKDVGQNHLLQMLAFATMESPAQFTNEAVTRERIKILQALVPLPDKLVLGQYQGYRQEKQVAANSQTDTYFAFKTEVNNHRFKGVPIYLRGGKNLKQNATEASIVFKTPANQLFSNQECGLNPNVLIYRLQPNEGIVLKVLTKQPGAGVKLEGDYMQYCYRGDTAGHSLPDPYEKLLFDAMTGNQTFFNDAQEVEAEWAFIDKLLAGNHKPDSYPPGSWGPAAADKLIEADGREWLEPSTLFCRP